MHKIMRTIRTVIAAALTCALAACMTLRVTSSVNTPVARTVQCHTVAWAGSFQGNTALYSTIANPVNESFLRTAIAAQLNAKGARMVTSGADCLVGYGIGSRNVIDGPYPYWGWGWGWGPGYFGGPYGPYVFREGIIAVDLYDARSRQALWHAYVHQDLYGLTGQKAEQHIDAAVLAIFTKYPG
ncbi:MAG: DUF4136 domain-containing protein [Steroidobacteraceae bacterium]